MDPNIKDLKETQSLDQSIALNRITLQLLKDRADDCRRLWIALIISILMNLVIVSGVLWYESQWDRTETVTTITQDTEDGGGNNVYQAGEKATYNEGGDNNGPADYSGSDQNEGKEQPHKGKLQ